MALLQVPANDALPIIILEAVAVVKRWLSSDYFSDDMVKAGNCSYGVLVGWWSSRGRARGNDWLHGYVSALVCSHLTEIRRP